VKSALRRKRTISYLPTEVLEKKALKEWFNKVGGVIVQTERIEHFPNPPYFSGQELKRRGSPKSWRKR